LLNHWRAIVDQKQSGNTLVLAGAPIGILADIFSPSSIPRKRMGFANTISLKGSLNGVSAIRRVSRTELDQNGARTASDQF
jgi:hypothetical protein